MIKFLSGTRGGKRQSQKERPDKNCSKGEYCAPTGFNADIGHGQSVEAFWKIRATCFKLIISNPRQSFFYLLTVRPTLCFTLSNSMLFHVNKLIFLIILQVKSNFWMITKESDCCDGSNFQCHVICKLWMDSMPVSNLTPDWLALNRHLQCLLPCARS